MDLKVGQRVHIWRTRRKRTRELFGKVEKVEFISDKYGVEEWRIVVDIDHTGPRSMKGSDGGWMFRAWRMGKSFPGYFRVAEVAAEESP